MDDEKIVDMNRQPGYTMDEVYDILEGLTKYIKIRALEYYMDAYDIEEPHVSAHNLNELVKDLRNVATYGGKF